MTRIAFVAFLVCSTLGCASGPRRLDEKLPWYGQNRARLDELIAARGKNAPGYDPAHKPFATFDWDNTCIRNDAGDATMFWMLQHDKVLQPPDKSWKRTSKFLTDGAAAALDAACGSLASAGAPLPTSTNEACATEIVSIYDRGKTTKGEDAFSGWNRRRMEPRYAWGAQLEAGHTADEVRSFAEAAMAENLARPVGATQKVGAIGDLAAYIRFYDQIHDLIGTLQANGIEVWVVSASAQHVAEPFAAKHNVARDHVIGVRSIVGSDGKLTYDLEGCGDVPDGDNAIITYIDGKRCFINKIIQGDKTAAALQQNPDAARRQILTGGDSDTDITFLKDATGARLVINRNRPEAMCNAYKNADDKWLVNPMFIEPFPKLSAPYPCSSTACKDESGKVGPCLDESGQPIPDQEDRIFAM
jgi:hypothetical protein